MKYEKFDVNYRPGRDYRELFDIVINNKHSTTSSIGITEEGELLYILVLLTVTKVIYIKMAINGM